MSDFNTEHNVQHLDEATKDKLDAYNQKKARNMSIAIFLYITSVAFLILFAALYNEPITGLIGMFIMIGIATGLIIYSYMFIPVDIIPYVKGKSSLEFTLPHIHNPVQMSSFLKLYWMLVTVIYLLVSFSSYRWDISWIIWLIAAAVKEAITLFAGASHNEE